MEFDLVFEGGGAKGMVFVGALQELEARGHSPARLLGTSAGSIMSTFLAAGYDAAEMSAALTEEQEGQPVFLGFLEVPEAPSIEEVQNSALRALLRDVNFRLVPDLIEPALDDAIVKAFAASNLTGRLFSFIERGGFFAAQNFIDWMTDKLNAGNFNLEKGAHGKGKPRNFGSMSLAEFNHATGTDLSLVASDTTDSQLLILNHRTAPDCPVVRAVRMSMSFPLLWHEVVWQPEWGPYRGKDISGHTVVDGGLLSNFPIELLISDQKHVTDVMGEKTTSPLGVLGFLIDETQEVPNAPEDPSPSKSSTLSKLRTVQRVQNLINTVTQAHDKMVIEAFERLVVRLPAKGYGTIEFGMSEAKREALIAAGRLATARHFDSQDTQPARGISFGLGTESADSGGLPTADRIASRILGN